MHNTLIVILASFALVIIFPFDFTPYAVVFPEGLRFLVGWMSNDRMRALWLLLSIGLACGLAYVPFAYKFIVFGSDAQTVPVQGL